MPPRAAAAVAASSPPSEVLVDSGLSRLREDGEVGGWVLAAAAIDRQTAAIEALTGELAAGREDLKTELQQTRDEFKPAVDAVHGLFEAQSKLCGLIVNHRLKIMGGVIAVLVAVNAISPSTAAAIANALKAAGFH
jgi:hypothetical protein